jgi:hypothetical protein
MKKKPIVFAAMLMVLFVFIGFAGCKSNSANQSENDSAETSTWTEIPVNDDAYNRVDHAKEAFDLRKVITDADYVFSGKIIDIKEYNVQWRDDKGELWGPFPSCVLEVMVTKEYYGESPVTGNILKIYYPYSSMNVFGDSAIIKKECDYVFISEAFDNEFLANKSPDDKFGQEKHADMYISDAYYRLLPIENEMVFAFCEFFNYNEEVMKQTLPVGSMTTDQIGLLPTVSDQYIALSIENFDKAFSKLFENPNVLPNAEDLRNMRNIEGENGKKTDSMPSPKKEYEKERQ